MPPSSSHGSSISGIRWLATIVSIVSCAVAAGPGAVATPPAIPQVLFRGSLKLPDAGVDQDGEAVVITGLSGVAWLGDDRYAAIMDNGRHLLLFRLAVSPEGQPIAVDSLRLLKLAARHDYEDIVPCPAPVAERLCRAAAADGADEPEAGGRTLAHGGVVLVCEEDTPAIRAIALGDGGMLASLPLPDNLRTRRPNRGLEALAIDPDGRHVWTANEEALPADGPDASSGGGTVVRLTRLPAPGVDRDATCFQAAYRVEPVHRHARLFAGPVLSGLVALVSLGDERLLVLERGGAPGLPPFSSRIYLVDVGGAVDVSAVERDLAARQDAIIEKRLLWSDAIGINVEGLCAGPPLADGNRLLVGIADNGGIGTPNQLVTLAVSTPAAAVDPTMLGAAAAIVAAAVVAGRLTSP